jgi:hypothetical protein
LALSECASKMSDALLESKVHSSEAGVKADRSPHRVPDG